VRADNFFLARARAKIDYRGGNGTAQLFAEGTSGVPFRVAINSVLTPNLIRAAAQGQVRNIPFRLARPAEIGKVAGGWQLAPVELVLPQGNVQLAGRWGNGLVVQSRLKDFDISILNVFSPGLGLGGRATGSIDFAQIGGDSFPRADARLNVAGFTRTGIAVRSPPVDLAIAGQLRPEGGQFRLGHPARAATSSAAPNSGSSRSGPARGAGRPGCWRRRSPAAYAITARPRFSGR
jgi:translocation and assembly module TamB